MVAKEVHGFICNLEPRETRCGELDWMPRATSRLIVRPESEWRDADITPSDVHTYTQAGGTCAGHGAVGAANICDRLTGRPYVKRNPYPVYYLARGGRPGGRSSVNWQAGSSLDANLSALREYGSPAVTADWPLGTDVPWPSDWMERMARGRVLEFLDAGDSEDEVFAVVASTICDKRYGNPWVIGTSAFGGAHCVVATYLKKRSDDWYLGGINSWGLGKRMGMAEIAGRWEYSRRQLRDMSRFGAWSPVSVTYATAA